MEVSGTVGEMYDEDSVVDKFGKDVNYQVAYD